MESLDNLKTTLVSLKNKKQPTNQPKKTKKEEPEQEGCKFSLSMI